MNKKKRILWALTFTAAVALTVIATGCSKAADQASSTGEQKVKTLLVGTSGGPKPYVYVDPNNNLDGYDIAVLKEIDKLLPQYDIQFEKTEFPSIFAGIDSGRYQIGANNITKKPEREEKYLFSNEYYYFNRTVVVVKKGRTDIKTINDLAGKTIPISPGGGFEQLFVEQFNKEHPDKEIKPAYTEQDQIKTYQDIANGAADFTFAEKVMLRDIEKEYGIALDTVELPKEEIEKIQNPKAYFIFSKTGDGPAIRDAFDGALRTLLDNGKLKELSIQYLGADYTR
jgi:polar amino acid transport system substrate-binding protein